MGFLIDINGDEKTLRRAITELYRKDKQGFTNLLALTKKIEKKPPFIPEEEVNKYFIFIDTKGKKWYQHLFYSEGEERICTYGFCGERVMYDFFNLEMFYELIDDYEEISAGEFYDNLYDIMSNV